MREIKTENEQAKAAAQDMALKDRFLTDNRTHILRLAGTITHSSITESDDEWSVALRAVSEAIDSYSEEKGNFWGYAAVVMKSRLTDHYRSGNRFRAEIAARPEVFDGDLEEDDPDVGLSSEVRSHIAVMPDTSLPEEIEALSEELAEFGISFFELAECSPKAEKTRRSCAAFIKGMFTPPPPLTGELRSKHMLPAAALMKRVKESKKLLERHRKYLIASTLILDGDYPQLSDYLGYIKNELRDGSGKERIS